MDSQGRGGAGIQAGGRARATKDLDLAVANGTTDGLAVRELLIEDGLRPDKALVDVVRHVFTIRDTHPCPVTIPDPPPGWCTEYPELANGLTDTGSDLPSALKLLRGFWSTAHDDASGTEH